MKLYELFSKRQKRFRGEVPDVYQYEDIPQELRVQVVHIWRDVLGEIKRGSFGDFSGAAYEAYQYIHDTLCREYGVFALGEEKNFFESVGNFLLKEKDIEKTLDVIELSFLYIDRAVRNQPNIYLHPKISPDEAINELNYRFREHGVGYQYKSGKIIKVDSQFIHSEAIKPALIMLSDPMYKGANEEFLKAHEHYRKGRYKECLNECLKAFESCLKTICQKRNWQYDDKRSTAKGLIQIVFDNGLIPSFMQSHFSALKSTLESGLPTVRNRQAGHGQGSTQVIVPEYIAAYALHLTASNILLLANADQDMK
ncbi:MAG: hypothetical protein OXC79_03965 [Candidatus Poribacteria bacterium]|nr:hypothetical protein [Candidatus Poribacteria bacterium]